MRRGRAHPGLRFPSRCTREVPILGVGEETARAVGHGRTGRPHTEKENAMESGITVTPEGLRDVSAQFEAGAAEIEKLLAGIATRIAPVRSEWHGAAKEQFETLWEQLGRHAKNVHVGLTGIAKLTQSAAASYESAEQSIAKSFSEFRDQMERLSTELNQVHERIKAQSAAQVEEAPLPPPPPAPVEQPEPVGAKSGSASNASRRFLG